MYYCHWCRGLIQGYPAELVTTDGDKEKFHAGPLRDCATAYEKWVGVSKPSNTREGDN